MSKNILSWLLACWLLMPLCPLFSQAADPQAAAHQTLLDLYRRSLSFSRLSPDSSRLYQERARNHQQRELPDCASCRARLNFLTTHRAYFQEQMETVITQGTIQAEAALRDSVVDWAVEELIYVAYAYQNTGRLARAGETHYRTLALMDESGVDHRRSDVLRALSELYRKQRNYEQCLSFAQRSVDLAQAQADTVASYHSINELANVYSTFDQLDSALYYYSQLIDTLKFHPVRPFDQMRTHLNLGRLYSLSSDYPRAEYHLREALVIYEREGWQSVGRLAHTLNELMTLYRRWGAYRSALRYGERLLPLVDSLSDVHLARNIFRQYRKVLVGLEDFEGAYRAGQRFQVLQDSIHRREERGIILDLEARYQNQAKQDRIALLEKDHQLNRLRWRGLLLAVLLGVVLLLLGFGFWINRQRRVRERLRLKAAQLQEMDALKTAFYTNVTHELRTPLTLILSPLEALLQEQYGPLAPAVRKIIRLTKRNAERLLRLSNDILDLSKLEARQLALVESAVDLPALVQRCCAHFETTARLREIDLRWVLPAADWPPLRLDRQKVEAILHNFLSNALKFTSRGDTNR
ncbi:MAG: tetratricopeptide repeat-containing sensor histidine kinase, partial [Bacteroidota bacterium]